MSTGLAEPLATSELAVEDWSARRTVEAFVNQEVQAPPRTTFIYNNTVFALGGFLPLLADGVAYKDLQAAYARALQERILDPAGMSGASVAEDPRGVVDDYAVGCALDLRLRAGEVPFGTIGGTVPAGGTLAHVGTWRRGCSSSCGRGFPVPGRGWCRRPT